MQDKRQFYINGQWVDPIDATELNVIDPATEEACAVISLGGQADTDAAVAAAKSAFPAWAATPMAERRVVDELLATFLKNSAFNLYPRGSSTTYFWSRD